MHEPEERRLGERLKRLLLCLGTLAGALAVLFPVGSAISASKGAASASPVPTSTNSPGPLWVTDCSTSQLSDIVAAYTATPAPHTTAVPIPKRTNNYLANVLRRRLLQCQSALKDYDNIGADDSPAKACTPVDRDEDIRVLWQQLQFCVALRNLPYAGPAPAASPSIQWKLPSTTGSGNQPVIFVLGAAGDPAMLAKLISTLTHYLNQTATYIVGGARLIPEPAMSTADFITQCGQSPQVKGAIVVAITAAGSGASDQFFSRKNWSAIEATALYADCERSRPSASGLPAYVWASSLAYKSNHYITPTPLTPLAILLTLGAAYEEFAPSRTTSTVTTRVYPTPLPLPTSGRISQVQMTNSQTLNASSLSSVAIGFLGSSITYTNVVAPLTGPPTIDQQTWDTLQDVAEKLVKDMNCWQLPAEALGGGKQVSDIVGRSRPAPAYVPPANLSSYSFGQPSAPFCAEPNSIQPAPTPTPPKLETPGPQPSPGGESIQDILPSTPPPPVTPSPTTKPAGDVRNP
jgi:hypothetical protein